MSHNRLVKKNSIYKFPEMSKGIWEEIWEMLDKAINI